ncbi:MAG: DHH family phosphoesterase [Clostridia bacterium]|nr:DHH family phosphoesterase [Clostridia bacterium]
MYQNLTLTDTATRLPAGLPTLILFHRHPDGDAIGAGFGLKLILEAMGCTALCVCEDEIPERLRFLTEGMQDSVLKENLPADFVPTQIISVDTASPAQAGVLYPDYEGKFDLMIDHHAKGEMYADGYIDGSASSAGELIYRLSRELMRMGRLTAIPEGVDRLLYAAVSSDTGCFRYSNASPETHRAAAALLEAGFDSADLNHRLFGVKSYKLLQAEKVGFDRLKLYADGRLGIVDMPYAVMEQYGFTDEHLGTLVDVARGLQGVQVAVAIRQPKAEGVYRVSMRSSCEVDVAAVCAEFGGGGHIKAAGCTVSCEGGIEAVVEMIAEAVTAVL